MQFSFRVSVQTGAQALAFQSHPSPALQSTPSDPPSRSEVVRTPQMQVCALVSGEHTGWVLMAVYDKHSAGSAPGHPS